MVRPDTAGRRRDRKSEILIAAADAFQRRGFAAVSTREVASSVGLSTPAALYRHFPNKQALLSTAIGSGLDLVDEARSGARSAEDLLGRLATVAVDRPDLWVLIRRESRHLDANTKAEILSRFDDLVTAVAHQVATERPALGARSAELRSRGAIAALAAPSQYRLRQGRRELRRTLVAVATTTALGDAPDVDTPSTTPAADPFDPTASRREEILSVAARLFAQRGYPEVSLDDIGAAAGMSGPSLYHHFSSKSEILRSVLRRSLDWIELDRVRAARETLDPREALDRLVGDYVSMARTHSELFRVFTHEAIYLPEDDRRWVLDAHRDFVQHWVALLVEARPGISQVEALTRVGCTLSIANDVSPVRLFDGSSAPIRDITALACTPIL